MLIFPLDWYTPRFSASRRIWASGSLARTYSIRQHTSAYVAYVGIRRDLAQAAASERRAAWRAPMVYLAVYLAVWVVVADERF
jgi:hypothetical protein